MSVPKLDIYFPKKETISFLPFRLFFIPLFSKLKPDSMIIPTSILSHSSLHLSYACDANIAAFKQPIDVPVTISNSSFNSLRAVQAPISYDPLEPPPHNTNPLGISFHPFLFLNIGTHNNPGDINYIL